MRLFIAINMDEETKETLENVKEVFRWSNIQMLLYMRLRKHYQIMESLKRRNLLYI